MSDDGIRDPILVSSAPSDDLQRWGCDLTADVTYSFLPVNSPLALLIILTFYFSVGDHDDDGHLLSLPSPLLLLLLLLLLLFLLALT